MAGRLTEHVNSPKKINIGFIKEEIQVLLLILEFFNDESIKEKYNGTIAIIQHKLINIKE